MLYALPVPYTVSLAIMVPPRNAGGACLKPQQFPYIEFMNSWTDFDQFWIFCCPVIHIISDNAFHEMLLNRPKIDSMSLS